MPGPEELKIVVRLKDFATKELKGVGKGVQDFAASATKAFAGISLGVFAAGAAGGAGLFALLKSAADRADNLNDLSRQLGVSVEALGALQFAAKQSGVSIEELETALKTLNKGFGELNATGGGPAAEALNKLSAGLRQAVRDGAPTEEIFKQIIRELEGLSTADRALVSGQLFGKGGSRLLRLVGEDVEGLMRRFRELGGVIDQDLAKSGDAFNDALNELSTAATGLANDIARALLPEAKKLVDLLTDGFLKNKPAVLGFLADVVDGFGLLASSLGGGAITIEKDLGLISGGINKVSRAALESKLAFLEVKASISSFNIFAALGDKELIDEQSALIRQIDEIKAKISELSKSDTGSGDVEAGIRAAIDSIGVAAKAASAKLRELAEEQKKVGEESEFMGPRLEDVFEIYGPYIEATGEAAAANAELFESVQKANRELEKQQKELESKDFLAGARKGFSDLAAESQKWGEVAQRAIRGVADSISDNLSDNLIAVINGTKNAKDAFRDFARGVLQDIQKIIIKELILKAIQGVLGSFGGGGDSLTGSGSAYAAAFGKGGVVDGHLVPAGHGLAGGGIVQREGLFRIRERGQNEAIVPLPDNRSIPVRFVGGQGGGGGGSVININLSYVSSAKSSDEERRMLASNAKTIASIVASELRQDANFREAMRPAA